jgi:ketosteroid isomerase-like protein
MQTVAEADQFFAVADRFLGALESGDVEEVLSCYAADARIWHNFDQREMTPGESIRSFPEYFQSFPTRKYLNVRRHHLPRYGLVQQHTLRLVRADGRDFDWPGCIIFMITGSKIDLLEEYVDMSSITQRMS